MENNQHLLFIPQHLPHIKLRVTVTKQTALKKQGSQTSVLALLLYFQPQSFIDLMNS